VPGSVSRNPGVTSAVDRYKKKAGEIDAVLNDNVTLLMKLDAQVSDALD
jgi:hypothetical protein